MLHRRADKVVVEDDPELSAPPEWRTKTPAKFARLRRLHALHAWLVQPVHASTVGMMRIFFSVCMYWQAQHFSDVFDEFLTSKQVFPYPGLGWVAPCGPALGRAILRTNSIAAVMTGAGVLTKPATLVLFLTFTYVFLLCESNHNNHYILICHVTFVASALDWGRYASVDAVAAHFWRRWTDRADKDKAVVARPEEVATVPYWNLLLLQLLFSIPCAAQPFPAHSGGAIPAQFAERVSLHRLRRYFFGFVAKCNEDWLFRCQPLKVWLAPGSAHTSDIPFGLGLHWWYPWFIAWGGMAYDGGIVFLLFSRRIRPLSFPAAMTFNFMNKLMFNIGIFPYAMLGSLVLYLPPDLFGAVVVFLRTPPQKWATDAAAVMAAYPQTVWHWWWFVPEAPPAPPPTAAADAHHQRGAAPPPLTWRQKLLLMYIGSFCVFHALYPLRHFAIYPKGVSWHEEGHLGAWHMKLRSKHGWLVLVATEADGSRHAYPPLQDPFIGHDQKKKVTVRPHASMLYAAQLARLHMDAGRNLSRLEAYSCFSLNSRAPGPLFIPHADLLDYIGNYELIPPLGISAVDKFLAPSPPADVPPDELPACDPRGFPHPEAAGADEDYRQSFASLHADAGLVVHNFEPGDSSSGRWERAVVRERRREKDAGGRPTGRELGHEYAYTLGLHRMDDKLEAYLAARPRRPTDARSVAPSGLFQLERGRERRDGW